MDRIWMVTTKSDFRVQVYGLVIARTCPTM